MLLLCLREVYYVFVWYLDALWGGLSMLFIGLQLNEREFWFRVPTE